MTSAEPLSPLLSVQSGAVGDSIYSRNRHGPYLRPRNNPPPPSSIGQFIAQQALRDGNTRWRSFAPGIRQRWAVYASRVPFIDRLGQSQFLSTIPMFLRSYIPRRLEPTATIPGQAPAVFALPELRMPEFSVFPGVTYPTVAMIPALQPWLFDNQSYLFISIGYPLSPNANFYAGPYWRQARFRGGGGPVPFPFSFVYPFPATSGDKLTLQLRLSLSSFATARRIRRTLRVP